MASVTFSTTVGGDGTTVSDDSNPSTGLANGGHRTRFVPALAQVVAVAGNTVTKATEALSSANQAASSASQAAASAASAINAPGTSATSTTSLAVGTGSKTFTIQTGKAFAVGQFVVAASAANVSNYMYGQITAHNPATGSLTVEVTLTNGSGTYADWSIALVSPVYGDVTLNGTQTLTNKTLTTPIIAQNVQVVGVNTNAVRSRFYVLTASLTLTLPSSPAVGDWVSFINRSGTTTATIARNGTNIMSLAEDMTLDSTEARGTLVYADATRGWTLID